MQQEQNTALTFVDDYMPGVGFRAVSRVQQPTVNRILGYVNPASPDESQGAVVDPADWNGYIVNYTECGPGNYNLVFLREGALEEGQTYSFTTDAVYFSHRLQLLEAPLQTGDEAAQQAEEGEQQAEQQTEEETTTEETTAEETTEETTTTTEETTDETTTTTEETTTTAEETTTTAETTTTEETTTTTQETPTATTADETTTAVDETTTAEETTTTVQDVIVNATETTESE